MNVKAELQNPQIAERLMMLFCEEALDWMCDEMNDDEIEEQICTEKCEYRNAPPECVIRYIKMQFRHEGKKVE